MFGRILQSGAATPLTLAPPPFSHRVLHFRSRIQPPPTYSALRKKCSACPSSLFWASTSSTHRLSVTLTGRSFTRARARMASSFFQRAVPVLPFKLCGRFWAFPRPTLYLFPQKRFFPASLLTVPLPPPFPTAGMALSSVNGDCSFADTVLTLLQIRTFPCFYRGILFRPPPYRVRFKNVFLFSRRESRIG